MRRFKKPIFIFCVAMLAFLVIFLAFHNVSGSITKEDREYIILSVKQGGYDYEILERTAHKSFQHEIDFIRAIQDAILNVAPRQKRIALKTSREPKRLYELNYAQCGDRSRFLEKALGMAGFKTRYASIYSTKDTKYPLFKKGGDGKTSHALIEVKTQKGWMIVDSVERWIGLTKNDRVVGLGDWQNMKNSEWAYGHPYFLIQDDFIYIYGLYSRHGQFYTPYTPYVPDINWSTFLRYNLF